MINRTKNIYKSIKLSLSAKVCAILVSLIVTPILYKTLGSESYGIWATILPIFTWFTFFDFGVGNGLRNVITDNVASKDYAVARKYIANAFSVCFLIGCVFLFILLLVLFLEHRYPFLVSLKVSSEVLYSISVVVVAAIISFVLGLVNHLHHSLQESHYVTYGQLINSILILLLLCPVYLYFIDNSVLVTSVIYSFSLVLSLLILVFLFFRKHRYLLPSLSDVNIAPQYSVLRTGAAFFIIQLCSLLIFSSDKILITSFVGATETSGYDIVYKYFSIAVFLQSVITTPAWGAIADAIAKKDIAWIDKAIKIQIVGFFAIVVLMLFMLYFSGFVFDLWIGDGFKVNYSLLVWMVVFIIIMSWNNVFAAMLSGSGVLTFQVAFAVIAVLINIPLSIILLLYYKSSAESVLISSSISLSLFALFSPIYLKKKLMRLAKCY